MTRDDPARLREEGLGDEAVLHVVEVVSYFNFVNRMADGLGVRLEEAWPHPLIGDPDGDPAGRGGRDGEGRGGRGRRGRPEDGPGASG